MSSITRGTSLFAIGTLLSRVTGLLRESVLAYVFGTSVFMDAFFVANRIPNMLRELLAEGALGSSFTKVYGQLNENDPQRANQCFVDGLWFFSIFLVILVGFGILFAPQIVDLLTLARKIPDQQDVLYGTTVKLTQVLFPFIGFMTMGAIIQGVLHYHGRFFLSATSPILLNLGYIVGALALAPLIAQSTMPQWAVFQLDPSLLGLCLGVLLGGILQTLAMFMGVLKPVAFFRGLKWRIVPLSRDLMRVFVLMGPMIIAAAAGQINVLINTNFATSLGEGAVSWLAFSFRILQLPIGLFGVAVGVSALPALTRAIANDGGRCGPLVQEKLVEACKIMIWLMVPCFCLILMNGKSIVILLYSHGAFSTTSTTQTSLALTTYSFSLVGYGMIKVLTSFYYAVDRTPFAMRVSLISIVINFLSNYFLVDLYGHLGLAASTSIVLSFNAIALAIGLRYSGICFNRKLVYFAAKMLLLLASLALTQFAAQWILSFFSLESTTKWTALLQISINSIIVLLITFGFVYQETSLTPRLILRTLRRK